MTIVDNFVEILGNHSMMYLQGLGMNLLLTLLSCILPVLFGVIWILISKTHIITHRIVKLLSQFWECFTPMIVIVVVYYGVPQIANLIGLHFRLNPLVTCVIGFSICFLGFLPARQKSDYSIIKNILLNTVDLIATVFMWTLTASIVAFPEIVYVTKSIVGMNYRFFETYLIPLVISFAVLAVLKLIKYLLEEFME